MHLHTTFTKDVHLHTTYRKDVHLHTTNRKDVHLHTTIYRKDVQFQKHILLISFRKSLIKLICFVVKIKLCIDDLSFKNLIF